MWRTHPPPLALTGPQPAPVLAEFVSAKGGLRLKQTLSDASPLTHLTPSFAMLIAAQGEPFKRRLINFSWPLEMQEENGKRKRLRAVKLAAKIWHFHETPHHPEPPTC